MDPAAGFLGRQPAPGGSRRGKRESIVIDRKVLLKDTQRQVKALEKDLRAQVDAVAEVGAKLKAEYDRAFEVGRTAATWSAWLGERVTQAAVAWVLGTVFVRFSEDNGLLVDPFLAGPTGERMTLAEERNEEFYRENPHETARGWLLTAFDEIAQVPVGAGLFDRRHNALYQVPLSHDAAKDLIAFWRRRAEAGSLVHDFTDPAWDTRFLGDLYQDLSEDVRKKYALLQTPEFVEEFILDLTLTPAIEEFGYDEVKLIDPTCGSGHFLLGAFQRLLAEWEENAPSRDVYERVRLALDAVHGVDINPYAVAIARFRLVVAALSAAGVATLGAAARYRFPLHIAVGDSLLKSRQLDLFGEDRDELADFAYATEDLADHPGILEEGRYHAVVGNPPYITVKDRKLNELYRELYSACSGLYSLTVPFAERFFELAKQGDQRGQGAGRAGQITANSFMKREFGRKLVTDFYAQQVELTHVVDTSGAYIPGHGTPTVVIIGKRNRWNRSTSVRAVLGVRGEPAAPSDPRAGLVWRAIVDQVHNPGSESKWVSVTDHPRVEISRFPWSLSGGGAGDLQNAVESAASSRLSDHVVRIGFMAMSHADDVLERPKHSVPHSCRGSAEWYPLVDGTAIRDYAAVSSSLAWFPYHQGVLQPISGPMEWLWPFRTELGSRTTFTKGTYFSEGRPWHSWHQVPKDSNCSPNSIGFAFVGTHNHFIFEHSGRVFKQSSPVIKFPVEASEEEHLRLLGVLNSSTACFWLKQVSHNKGRPGAEQAGADEPWEHRYEFTGTKIQEFPLPFELPLGLARELDGLAQRLTANSPASLITKGTPTRSSLAEARTKWESTRGRMVAFQEELDWQVYRTYGLLTDDLTAPSADVPELAPAERAFAIVLARSVEAGDIETTWFSHHNHRYDPITEPPAHWPAGYRALVEKRIGVIEANRNIGLIERPEYKRRWATEGWDKLQDAALRDWLLDRLETRELWFAEVDGMVQPRLWTTARLADELAADADFVAVADIYRPGEELSKVVAGLIEVEHVPYLAALRYADTGLEKRADWEFVWDQQRAEDAEPDEERKKKIRDAIPVPPRYAPKDFRKTSYWRARGKLDVPKERFISYPHASRDNDPTLLVGWAGWDHREQAQALATLLVEREESDGWGADRLAPLVAGLREVLPWVRQWHNEIDPLYDGSPAEVYDAFLSDARARLHLTDEALSAWRPQAAGRGRKKKAATA
ncbi:BREX-2 system adenine-specific DNA-methyltransferase PglX [Pseudofrankia sp. BMG5.37]|uniref:BREX-2 system adenine-specific DNA-methyltransferase PglX n=1 Tax=Pseudofrankia sp. BMG5.37 TaxID=3050035 RepID=UPI0028958599|nr:BREX-2 system adenine-specific DNA-methyltransferase PglX [Pseudofrankia sp. BMG5.37]MDT3441471.1 BREX-2 system adenine-specific DNA-methyltransferase PglX [Pseudofrankia sp. BMG5.37]